MIGISRYKKLYDKYFTRLLKRGKIPTYEEVTNEAGDKLNIVNSPDEPVYKYRPQVRKSVFDVDYYNEAIDDISFDLDVLFEDLEESTKNNMQRILHANMFHTVHNAELTRLSNTLDALLFSTDGGDENFFVQFEDFSSFNKTDTEYSTNGIVNTSEKVIALPVGLHGSLKIDMSHLQNTQTASDWQVSRSDIRSEEQHANTKIGDIVKDTAFPWGYTIVTENDGPLEVSFTLRLKHEEFINRISVVHFGYKPTTITIKTSVDKKNIKDIQDYAGGVVLQTQAKTYGFDFDDRLVDYLHITLRKEQADTTNEEEDGSKSYSYDFGIRNISVYSTGRLETAIYQSKAFDFSEDLAAIGRIALNTTEIIPENTSVDWYIVPISSDGTQGSSIAITPQNHSTSAGPPKTIVLQDVLANSKSFTTSYSNIANIENYNNISYWRIQLLNTKPVFGTAKLYRGFKSWYRDSSAAVNPVLVKDNYITFSKGDTQSLYNTISESHDYVISDLNGDNVVTVVLNNRPLYNPAKGHFLIPEPGINTDKDTQPNYAIYSVSLNTSTDSVTTSSFTFDGGTANDGSPNVKDTGIRIIKYANPGDVVLKKYDGSYTYIDGTHYIVQLNDDGYPTGKIVGLHTDLTQEGESGWQSVKLTYNRDTNLTRFVTEISGQQIYFNLEDGELPSDASLIIKYRYAAQDILKASVKAKSMYGILLSDLYIQGVDYIFDSSTGTIQRLTTGSINPGADIYVDYKYNDLSDQLEQFFIWAHVEDKNGKTISTATKDTGFLSKESTLVPNTELGEQLLANIPAVGLIDLSKTTEWPTIQGWVQFVVKSITPTVENNALINQVIKLKDNSGQFIFVQSGKYFDTLTAIRDPLIQVAYPFLKNGVLKNDHTKFSIREVLGGDITYEVITNFQPNTDDMLYRYTPNSVPGTGEDEIIETDEEWQINWSSTEVNNDSISRLAVKAVLNRNKNVDGNITPKVDKYFLKVGF